MPTTNLYTINDRLPLNNDQPGTPQFPRRNTSPPPFMMVANQFCQDSGAAFVEFLSANGGADSLSKAYSRPPRSTAEIIHPGALYKGAEPFAPVDPVAPDAAVAGLHSISPTSGRVQPR